MLQFARANQGKLNDTTFLRFENLLDSVYGHVEHNPFWSDKGRWLPTGDSLYKFIEGCKDYGLFPTDYHYLSLAFIHRVLIEDSMARKNAAIWARADLMMTDAFFGLVKDLKQGRLVYDSVTLRKDTVLSNEVYTRSLSAALDSNNLLATLQALEPKHRGYDSLKAYIPEFLATAHFRKLTPG